jgi:hypothetical protein
MLFVAIASLLPLPSLQRVASILRLRARHLPCLLGLPEPGANPSVTSQARKIRNAYIAVYFHALFFFYPNRAFYLPMGPILPRSCSLKLSLNKFLRPLSVLSPLSYSVGVSCVSSPSDRPFPPGTPLDPLLIFREEPWFFRNSMLSLLSHCCRLP